MRVSAIVPLYNKADFIERALASISAQTFEDLEIIVVDDGSTDDGARKVAAFPDRRVRLIRQENGGPGAARNRAILSAGGDLLAFLDADDEWMPQHLESKVHLFDEFGPSLAAVTSSYIDHPQNISTEPLWRKRGLSDGIYKVSPETSAILLGTMVAFMWPCATVARTNIVRRFGGFYEDGCRFGEDAMLWLKVLLNETVYFQMQPTAHFHREASALSGNYTEARPIEPFLLAPEAVERCCPQLLKLLLARFHAIRACKTAAMLGY